MGRAGAPARGQPPRADLAATTRRGDDERIRVDLAGRRGGGAFLDAALDCQADAFVNADLDVADQPRYEKDYDPAEELGE